MSRARAILSAVARAVGRRRLGVLAPAVPVFPEVTIEGVIVTIEAANLLVGEA